MRYQDSRSIGLDWLPPGERVQQEASRMDNLESTHRYYGKPKSYTDLYHKELKEETDEVLEAHVLDEIDTGYISKESKSTKQEISINVPSPKLQHHFETIAKRKQISELEMISLTQELCVLATYKQQHNVLVENCRFSVGLSVGEEAVSVTFYLKKVNGKDKKKTTWRQFVSKSLVTTDPSGTTIANFTVNSSWQIIKKELHSDVLRLLTPARILVREQLGVSELEALDDIEYFEETAEKFDD